MKPNGPCEREAGPAGRLAYAFYDAVGAVAALGAIPLLPWLLWRGAGAGLGQRLGRLPETFHGLAAAPVWIHAASVGETLAVAPLVSEIRARHPGLAVVASSTTLTGREVACRELRADAQTLLPFDALRVVDRVLCRVRPRCIVLVETEIWPGLLRAAGASGIPVVLVSGRVSAGSHRRYAWIRPLLRAALACVERFGMQTAADAERIIDLGAPAARVEVTGSLKASRAAPGAGEPIPVGGLERRRVLVAASTQPGEEEAVLSACAPLWGAYPDLLLLLAPRRPERFEAVSRLVDGSGVRYQRRSRMEERVAEQTQVLILDTIGELARFFPAALAVFVGGTLAPVGGHNVLEPAVFGKPVLFGPHTGNVADAAAALCQAGGAERVDGPADLTRHWRRLLEDPGLARTMGARAREAASGQADALRRTWALLAPYLAGAPVHEAPGI